MPTWNTFTSSSVWKKSIRFDNVFFETFSDYPRRRIPIWTRSHCNSRNPPALLPFGVAPPGRPGRYDSRGVVAGTDRYLHTLAVGNGVSSLWAVFAGLCMSPIGRLTFEGIPPQIAGPTAWQKLFMRSFNGTVGILLAVVLIDQGAWWGLDFVRDAIVQGQGSARADVPGIRDYLVRHGGAPPAAAMQAQGDLGLLGQPARAGHWLPHRIALLRLLERGGADRLVLHQPAEGAQHH
jgi:hypothetical protein